MRMNMVTNGEVEQALILATLAAVKGDRLRAAELLGISLPALYYKMSSKEPKSTAS